MSLPFKEHELPGRRECPTRTISKSAEFFGTVDAGVSFTKLCLAALKNAGVTDVDEKKGRLHWHGELNLSILQGLRSFEKIFLSVARAGPADLEHAERTAAWEHNIAIWESLCGPVRSFRVNCKRSVEQPCGSTSMDIERNLGSYLQDQFAWVLDLKRPQLEVWVFAVEDETCVGLLLLHQAAKRQSYLGATGLHPNVCWALLATASVLPGETLLDPMCGTGMLLTEAPPGVQVVGVDISSSMIQRASAHLRSLRRPAFALFLADARHLPFADGMADVAVCDLPFGRQFGSLEGNKELYPQVMRELRRVVRVGGRCVILTSSDNEQAMSSGIAISGWTLLEKRSWKLGNKLPSEVYILGNGSGWSPTSSDFFHQKAGRFSLQRKQHNPDLLLCGSPC